MYIVTTRFENPKLRQERNNISLLKELVISATDSVL
jgi:hypothetical protein